MPFGSWYRVAGITAWTALAIAASTGVVRAQRAVQIAVPTDGELSADLWQTAPAADAFLQRAPAEGAAPTQHTEFRVAYDRSTIYVRVRADDTEADKITGYLTRRDSESPSDWIRILIDSYRDHRTAYEFAVNPAGVKLDRYWFNDTSSDAGWDAIWDAGVTRDERGWTAEFRIPFSQLRFPAGETTVFGLAVVRDIARLNETATWPLLPRSASGYVSSFGELTGLSMSGAPKRLELVPYTVATITTQPTTGNPLLHGTGAGAAAGLDLKYALSPGLTVTATLNPDFGQVEADPAVVNLSAFETFFSEQRPFFVEGSGALQFDSDCFAGPCTMFYSRRVGRQPQGPVPSGDDVHTDIPLQTTILGAAKLTGRVGPFSIGVMQAVTQEELGTVQDGAARDRRPFEPSTSYSVARIRREFANQSTVGIIATATRRQVPDALQTLPGSAYAGGIDWDLRVARAYALTGFWANSSVRGTPEAIADVQENSRHDYQRPDATSFDFDPSRTSLNGSAGRVGLSKIAGGRIRGNANIGYTSPGFEINDAGFLRRADERWTSNWLQIRSETPTRRLRNRYLNFNQFAAWNLDGDRVIGGGNVNGSTQFKNNWTAGGGIGRDLNTVDDRLTRGGPAGRVDGQTFVWTNLESDGRRRLSVTAFNGGGGDRHGSWFRDHELTFTYRPTTALTLSPGVRVNRAVHDYQWVKNVTDAGDHYVFGRLDQTTAAVTGRVNYTMTPNLSLQLYAQPFVSGGDYSQFKELVDGRNSAYDQRYSPFAYTYAPADNPNFNIKSLRTTNVLRWEFKPGSTLFVVWQQAREDNAHDPSFAFRRDFQEIFAVPSRNVLLVKLAYWLNY